MDDLIDRAHEAYAEAYTPYSEYPVGAALRTTNGTVYTGCNIENANYSNSLHAEEVALGKAISDGSREFDQLAVVSEVSDGLTPCGMCRQTLAEFCADSFEIITETDGKRQRYTLGELLPETISSDQLERANSKRGDQ